VYYVYNARIHVFGTGMHATRVLRLQRRRNRYESKDTEPRVKTDMRHNTRSPAFDPVLTPGIQDIS